MDTEYEVGRGAKRAKLLLDDELDDSLSDTSGGVPLGQLTPQTELRINKEYARRFEHNARRAELHRLEEKYGKEAKSIEDGGADEDSDESASTSTDEDDDGLLASGTLDDEFNATLRAIRNKDPRVYDAQASFYTQGDGDEFTDTRPEGKEKPMYLQDYHRQNLLRGNVDEEEERAEPTYAQQQEQLKEMVVREMHDAVAEADSEDDDEGFLVAKEKPNRQRAEQQENISITAAEVDNASADPEAFLTRFMDARAWIHSPGAALHPFESDDEDEDERAEEIEEAYNFRFEDPAKANEKLVSHARDAVEKYSARKEAPSKRQRAREADREQKLSEKQERKLEKARLRKLRVEEAQSKLARIKDAAGTKASSLKLEEWQDLLTGDWDEDQWEIEMQKKFDDAYYAEHSEIDSEDGATREKPKRPKWKDDIDITDLVPDFDGGDDEKFSLSSDDPEQVDEVAAPKPSKRQRSDKLAVKAEKRKERKRIEQLIDAQLDLDMVLNGPSQTQRASGFRYRETSPMAFGMTSKDILLAEDTQLNQFAGLKKLAAFRDLEKKRRDKKRLGKKARLREWRKETFGSERGPRKSLQDVIREQLAKSADGKEDKATHKARATKRKRAKDKSEA